MRIKKKILLIFLIMSTGLLAVHSGVTGAQTLSRITANPEHVPWSQLTFGAKNFSVEVTAKVSLEKVPAAEVEAALIRSPQGTPFNPSQPEVYKLHVERFIDPLPIFGSDVRTVNQIWFNPQDATTLARVRLRRGREDFKKIYRFTEQGVFRHRREPKDQKESSKAPEKWTDVKDTYYTYNLAQLGCATVSDRLLLMYIVSSAEISKDSQPLSVCVFGKRQLFHVKLRPEGLHLLKTDYIEKRQQAEVRRQAGVEALKIALEVEPLASDLDEVENFSFLGFRDAIAIYIDPVSNLPLQLSGEIPKVGEVAIKLIEAQLVKGK